MAVTIVVSCKAPFYDNQYRALRRSAYETKSLMDLSRPLNPVEGER